MKRSPTLRPRNAPFSLFPQRVSMHVSAAYSCLYLPGFFLAVLKTTTVSHLLPTHSKPSTVPSLTSKAGVFLHEKLSRSQRFLDNIVGHPRPRVGRHYEVHALVPHQLPQLAAGYRRLWSCRRQSSTAAEKKQCESGKPGFRAARSIAVEGVEEHISVSRRRGICNVYSCSLRGCFERFNPVAPPR